MNERNSIGDGAKRISNPVCNDEFKKVFVEGDQVGEVTEGDGNDDWASIHKPNYNKVLGSPISGDKYKGGVDPYDITMLPSNYIRGNGWSKVKFIPVGDQVLIEARGVATEMTLMTEDQSAQVALTFYVAGVGKIHSDCPISIDDKVSLWSTEEHAFKSNTIPGNELSIANHVTRLRKDNNLGVVAKHVAHDKARSKIALNHTSNVDANSIIQFDTNAKGIDGEPLFGRTEVDVVEYYVTNINNISGIYVDDATTTKEVK